MVHVREQLVHIDRIKAQKKKQAEAEEYFRKERIRLLQPSNHLITDPIKQKLYEVNGRIDQTIKEDVKLQIMESKGQFKKEFQKMDIIREVMDKDIEFKEQMKQTTLETQKFLNGVFQGLQDHNQQLRNTNAFSNLNKELKYKKHKSKEQRMTEFTNKTGISLQTVGSKVSLQSSSRSLNPSPSHREIEVVMDKPKFRGLVLRNMHKLKQSRTNEVKKAKLDWMELINIKLFSETLINLFKERDMGVVYKEAQTNIFWNEYLGDLQKTKQGIDLNLIGSKEKRENMESFNQYFTDQVSKRKFYDQAKEGRLSLQPTKEEILVLEYYQNLREKYNLPLPQYSLSPLMSSSTLFLNEIKVNDSQADALKEFFEKSKGMKHMKIRNIILNNNGLKDAEFAKLLEGINIQNNLSDEAGLSTMQKEQQGFVQRLIYQNNEFGWLSLKQITNILPPLLELSIVDSNRSITNDLIIELTGQITNYGKRLMKMKFSKINMNDKTVINNVIEFIGSNIHLNQIEMSWCQLKSENLLRLATIMAANPYSIRSVNLSYNNLNLNSKQKEINEKQNSINFIQQFLEFVKNSESLNHVDFSGLFQFQSTQYEYMDEKERNKNKSDKQKCQQNWFQYGELEMTVYQDQLTILTNGLATSQVLNSIHLSDNGIMLNQNFCYELMDIFGIPEEELDASPKDTIGNMKIKQKIQELTDQARQTNFKNDEVEIVDLEYTSHLIKSKQTKALIQKKMINDIQLHQGIGCSKESGDDIFVLNRNANNPELIFEQRFNQENYFDTEASQRWKLAGNDCQSCNKHSYVVVCYEQTTDPNKNQGLEEITDKKFVKKLSEYLGLNLKDLTKITPFISGTVVKGGWKRSLKMLRSELYSTACIAQSKKFIDHRKKCRNIKKGVATYAEKNQDIREDDVIRKTQGWNNIMNDKINNNYLTDVNVVNEFPDLENAPPANVSFVYAAYVKPGQHKFLIYCPKTQRAFYKHIIVQLNSCDQYPEFPLIMDGVKIKKPVQNVWKSWQENTKDFMNIACSNDISHKAFNIDTIIKDSEQRRLIYQSFIDHFESIQIYFQELIVLSTVDFQIDFITIFDALNEIKTPAGQESLEKSKIGLQFQTTMRNKNDLRGAMNRPQLLEILVRCASQVYSTKNLSDNIKLFYEHYIQPVVDRTQIKSIRKEIRLSSKLNNLLQENESDLIRIYNDYSENGRGDFTINSAKKLFGQIQFNDLGIIKASFIYSQMTIQHEASKSKKYRWLYFVEFLEMLCRVAPHIDQNQISGGAPVSIAIKVNNLLREIFDYRKAQKLDFDGEGFKELESDHEEPDPQEYEYNRSQETPENNKKDSEVQENNI